MRRFGEKGGRKKKKDLGSRESAFAENLGGGGGIMWHRRKENLKTLRGRGIRGGEIGKRLLRERGEDRKFRSIKKGSKKRAGPYTQKGESVLEEVRLANCGWLGPESLI